MDECKDRAFVGLRWLSRAAIVLLLTMTVAASASASTSIAQDKSNEMEVQPGGPKLQSAGIIVWKGLVEKDGIIEIDGDKCDPGSIQAGLPGVPVTINFDTKNYAMVEFPSASNGYKRMKIRSRSRKESIILNWQLANAVKKENPAY
jgi:hypothetical protein